MPIPVTPKPTYPDVPQAPGVPPLLRRAGQIQSIVVLAVADAAIVLSSLGLLGGPQWGLFTQAGAPAFGAASSGIATVITNLLSGGSGLSVGDVEFRLDHRISTAPQEQGAFSSFNKVSTPFNGRVTYIVSGTEAQRTQFLSQALALQKSLTLLSLVMPEYSYPSCNVVHHDFRRTASKGVTMIEVDIWVEEIRFTATAAFSNTAAPSGAAQVNNGTAQPQPLTPTQNSNVAGQQSVGAAGGLT